MKLLYPGSFDPLTFGHLDIIKRAAALSDKLIIALLHNPEKKTLFTIEERLALLKEAVSGLENTEVRVSDTLLVQAVRQTGADAVVRGLRFIQDYDSEYRYAIANRRVSPGAETLFLPSDPACLHISSSIAKEVASYGGDLSALVPDFVARALERKLNEGEENG